MTSYEAKMKFKPDFFQEENREGFVVPEMMKRAWAAAYEVLEVIDEVCSKLDIKYYSYGGTLLGAVRHKGFIPWDDDIDICMLKDDYIKFIANAPSVLPEGFVLSGLFANEPRLWNANKEPQARVMADEQFFPLPKYMNRFHSFPYMRIGVDIFPLYYLPRDLNKQLELIDTINELQVTAAFLDRFKETGELTGRIRKIENKLIVEIDCSDEEALANNLRLYADQVASNVDSSEADLIFNTLYLKPTKDRNSFTGYCGYKEEWFGEGDKLKFEDTEIIVPKNYKEVLEVEFGKDYMTPKMFTAEHTYPFYQSQEEAFKKLLLESNVNVPVDEFCRNWHLLTGGN